MKRISLLAIILTAVAAIAYFMLQDGKQTTQNEMDYGNSSSKFRYAQKENLSPYAIFGDSSVVLLTEAERVGKQFIEIINSDKFSKVRKIEIHQKTGIVKFIDKNGVVVNEMILEPETVTRFLSVDPMAEERSWVSPYNYVQNNPLNRIDPTGAIDDPIFDSNTGEFLGHYGDSDFEGEIMLMDALTYRTITEGNDVVISYDLAEQHGTYLQDMFKGKEMPTGADLKLLSNVFTNLLSEAANDGLIEFDKSRLKNGRIGVSGADGFTYPAGYNYASSIANTGPIESDGRFQVWSNIQYYDKNRDYVGPHIKYMTHAGNAISILGVHEYGLHGVAGLQGNHNHPKIYPIQWEQSKNYIGGEYKEILRKRAGQ
ncbi:MAG TPA: RHS repeat-associated core domain-containing protein [Saprospiraceae bacterium]|nr:RHS repeat-associated core domain-containing protein [Saprospiraceae bacterium]HMQ84931.1 RHS repeat-associated core domain-containing protein [Saprospiraceae bacterium]